MSESLKRQILEDIERYDGSDRAFSAIIAMFLDAGTSPEAQAWALAGRVEVAKTTIGRWAKGKANPPPFEREGALDEIRNILTAP